ncbi:hypothetical protein Tco_0823434 [Tanacetum coccineum]|uniref:Uncharacterized protein n=1 Tax=Tanacetum coccineum TaxID=301880 RepID=A0ABQ5AI08_9ASTR
MGPKMIISSSTLSRVRASPWGFPSGAKKKWALSPKAKGLGVTVCGDKVVACCNVLWFGGYDFDIVGACRALQRFGQLFGVGFGVAEKLVCSRLVGCSGLVSAWQGNWYHKGLQSFGSLLGVGLGVAGKLDKDFVVGLDFRSLKDHDNLKPLLCIPNVSSALDDIVAFLIPVAKIKSIRSVVCKLVFSAACYFLWQERNYRIFKKKKRSKDKILELIKSNWHLHIGDGSRRDETFMHMLCVLDGFLDVSFKSVKFVMFLVYLVSSHGWLGLSTQPTPRDIDRWKRWFIKVKALLGAIGVMSGSRVRVVWMEVGGGVVRARVVSRVVFKVEELALEAMENDDQGMEYEFILADSEGILRYSIDGDITNNFIWCRNEALIGIYFFRKSI